MSLFRRIMDAVVAPREKAGAPLPRTPSGSKSRAAPGPSPATSREPVQSTPAPASLSKKKQILFLEADHLALRDLSRGLDSLRGQWEMAFAVNPREALELMDRTVFDAVVAGLTLSGTTGVGFLNEVTKRHPKTLRFIRCTLAERKDIKGFTGTPAQHFATDLDARGALQVIRRAFLLDDWFSNSDIKALLARVHKLPTLPTLYTRILHELQSPDVSVEAVARLIAKDPVMTAKMLQLVNSVYFALPREVNDPAEAVMFLGAERTRSLILLAKVFSQFDKTQCEGFQLEELWRHSLAVGSYAHIICQVEHQDTQHADQAFTAGLLHDIGKLLLAGNFADQYDQAIARARRQQRRVLDLEFEVFGATHAELAACLLGTWGFPLGILEAVAWHHRPELSEDAGFSLLTAVHVTNAIDHEKTTEAADLLVTQIDASYTRRLGLTDRHNSWRVICGCLAKTVDEVATGI
jgi:putative nucleotidyltransferase with HDIG domain